MPLKCIFAATLYCFIIGYGARCDELGDLPVHAGPSISESNAPDYLVCEIDETSKAWRSDDDRKLILDNGLIRRTWAITPNAACVGFDNLMTGQSMLRSVQPEALLTIDGTEYKVGGLVGQPNQAYLTENWLKEMQSDPTSMQFTGLELGEPQERFGWARSRHHAPDTRWPPAGVHLQMNYELPQNRNQPNSTPSDVGRKKLWHDTMQKESDAWNLFASEAHQRTSFSNEGKFGEIYALTNTSCYAERKLNNDVSLVEVVLHLGTDKATSWGPGLGLVFENGSIKLNCRPGDRGQHGHFELRSNGEESLKSLERFADADGGLQLDQSLCLRVRRTKTSWIWEVAPASDKASFTQLFETPFNPEFGQLIACRIGKMDRNGESSDEKNQPGELGRSRILSVSAWGEVDRNALAKFHRQRSATIKPLEITVHYEMYDGVPVMSKWITVRNQSQQKVTVNRLTAELLAAVEHESPVETPEGVSPKVPQYLHVETDFALGGMVHQNANRHVVHWKTDPSYKTQVNYRLSTPCLLRVEPTYGPEQDVEPGETFESFRVFELIHRNDDREHRGLAIRRMYRTIAPWVTENPITHHLLNANPDAVRTAIDQAEQVGFECIIMSFGSGFNMENTDPKFLQQWKQVAEYATSRGIELGSYSLFSSRGVGQEHMIVSPEGQRPTHGRCPAVTSLWGQQWIQTIRQFYRVTGFRQFENDGPYPGDVDVTPRRPRQKGIADSRWVQWRDTIAMYRSFCEEGVYINAPDYYFLNGATKSSMGYREVNWSLPRSQQVIHTRQNIYDGTWQKTPSMGWMHVPLAEYQGGGAAATIEPLHEHLPHYEMMLRSNLGLGVQAHYRGPRLFDTPETQDLVSQVVEWFKRYRDILESDVIHGRRADGQDIDWMLHVNPNLETQGMLCIYNPLDIEVTRTLCVDLYFTGLSNSAQISHEDKQAQRILFEQGHRIKLSVKVPASSMTWYTIRK